MKEWSLKNTSTIWHTSEFFPHDLLYDLTSDFIESNSYDIFGCRGIFV